MRRNHIPPYDQLEPRDGVLVVDGYGIALKVNQGHLVAMDGVGRMRRSRRFPKAGHGLERVVLLGSDGYLTLEAVNWLDHLRIPLIHVTADGRSVLSTTRLGLRDARLRRTQALAPTEAIGFELSGFLLGRKIDGQVRVARMLGNSNAVDAIAERLEGAENLEQLLLIEARVAAEYWALWETIPVRFVTRDETRVPESWLRFGTRSSPVSGRGPRLAANPANAILNYLYALLEAETVLACHAVGLDPQLGFFHADTPARDSLAADVMEAVRPTVDRYILDLIGGHRFSRKDFAETPQGVCRLAPQLAHRLAETSIRWAAEIAPVVEEVARTLVPGSPTLLTQRKRRAAHGHPEEESPRSVSLDQGCLDCGAEATPTGRYCGDCADRRVRYWLPELSERATAYLARARADGNDPAHGGAAGRKRSRAIRRRNAENAGWDARHARPDPSVFVEEILPGLRDVAVSAIVEATGLSRPYCSMIRRGAYIPHSRHWEALQVLASSPGVS
ncbi:MAG: CRISPR-associated endonuclease Cas1 [Acidimicrobiia bacterium]|nr:CRISPR-associated endonuclease Cas1 [Acidimicrobiia bacterium]